MYRIAYAPATAITIFLIASQPSVAAPEFFQGKTISLVVSSPAGGGYDTVARALAPFLSDHIPGHPKVVVQNMPGAGGLTEMNYAYSSASRDGLFIAGVQNSVPFEPLFGTKQAKFDSRKFAYLGSPDDETDVLVAWKGAGAASVDDLRKRTFAIGSTGAKSNPSIWAKITGETLGLKLKTVVGYPGQGDILLGMQRGEVSGTFIFWNSLKATKKAWLEKGDLKVLLQIGDKPNPELKTVPFAESLASRAEDRQLMREAAAPLSLGRPYLLPPGVPADRVGVLRKAMAATFHDPKFVAALAKLGVESPTPKTGEEIQSIVEAAYDTPPKVRARLLRILGR